MKCRRQLSFSAIFLLILLGLLSACSSPPPTANVKVVTAIPTIVLTASDTPIAIEAIQIKKCSQADQTLPTYEPTSLSWISIRGTQFELDGNLFEVRGLNYYPRLAPFERFFPEMNIAIIKKELEVIQPIGINSLRIFLTVQDLFVCDAIPNLENFQKLDELIKLIAESNFRLIIVLNRFGDNYQPMSHEQAKFIANRYQDEPAIILWDILDRGDLAYELSSQVEILTELADLILALRQADPNHLITAGWWEQALDTEPLVDIVSFQHYGEYEPLRQSIANIRSQTGKPILLTAIGYSTFNLDETAQRNLLYQAFEEVRSNRMAGWMIYMAFDYPSSVTCIEPDCPAKPSDINFFGIWNTSYFPKLAVDAVKRISQNQ